MRGSDHNRRRAFSLIELVIVIIILGVISAIAIPRMMEGADNAAVTGAAADLAVLRGALEMARYEHAAYPADATEFVQWLTTQVAGNGPYIVKVPPLKTGASEGATGVLVIASDPPAPPDVDVGGTIGWLFNPTTGGVWANDASHLDL